MQPADARNLTWADIESRLAGMRERVYWGFVNHGPCTTLQLAARAQISLLTLRPRTTELVDLGLVEMVGMDGHDGVYKAVLLQVVRERLTRPSAPARQMDLRLGV